MNKDRLETIFILQEKFNKQLGIIPSKMSKKQQQEWILNYSRAMQQEIAELIDSLPWKWWAKYQKFDKQNAKIEIIDLLHFVISLAQVLGMNSNDLYNKFLKKNKVNFNRQKTGYIVKNSNDCMHI